MGLLIYLLFCIWATDIGAYAAGKSIGGPKLAPRISPKKTWAGLVGGMLSAAAFGAGVAVAFDAERPWLAAVLGMVLAVVGQIGDLFESGIKRRFDVKDSGRLIPGHGGLLDRVDGLIVAAPVFALFHATLGKLSHGGSRRAHVGADRISRRVTILGSTGSVGRNTVDLISRDPGPTRWRR